MASQLVFSVHSRVLLQFTCLIWQVLLHEATLLPVTDHHCNCELTFGQQITIGLSLARFLFHRSWWHYRGHLRLNSLMIDFHCFLSADSLFLVIDLVSSCCLSLPSYPTTRALAFMDQFVSSCLLQFFLFANFSLKTLRTTLVAKLINSGSNNFYTIN